MALDQEAATVLELMKKSDRPAIDTMSAQDGRAQADMLSERAEAEAPSVARVFDGAIPTTAGELRYRRYWPMGAVAPMLPALIYYHGGGFVIGNLETHDSTCRRLANKSQCQVIAIDYRLAPEHPFPAAVEDALAAFRHIANNAHAFGADPARLAVGGDSAGGNLAAVVCQQQKLAGGPMPAFQMLIYPATDSLNQSASRRDFAEGYFLTAAMMKWFFDFYTPQGRPGSADLADIRVSPLLAEDFAGLPPAFVLTAGYDPLRDEGKAYAEKMLAAGVKVTYANYPGTIHGFFSMTRFLQQGLKANDEAALVMRAHFGA
jgi:acetyl esterase